MEAARRLDLTKRTLLAERVMARLRLDTGGRCPSDEDFAAVLARCTRGLL